MKRLISLTLIIFLTAALLCACSDEYKIIFEKVEDESSDTASDVNSTSTTKKVYISAERPSENFLNSTKNYHLYKAEGENYVTILYKAKAGLSNVELFKLKKLENGTVEKGEVVYSLERLSTSKHLVASTLCGEEKMGISFYDSEGHLYAYEIDIVTPDSSAKIKLNEIDIPVLESDQTTSK